MRATASRAPLTSARASSPCRAARVKTLRPWSGSECVSSSRAGANAAPIAAIARRSRPSLTLGTATRMGTRGSVAGAERERLLRLTPDHVGGAREQLVLALAKLLGAHLDREAALLAERDPAAVEVDAHVLQPLRRDADLRLERARRALARLGHVLERERRLRPVRVRREARGLGEDVVPERLQPVLRRVGEVREPEQVLGAAQQRVVVVRRVVDRAGLDVAR